jgi:hypothetical protein
MRLEAYHEPNFVVSAEFAKAFNKLDGEGLKAYIGFNYIF